MTTEWNTAIKIAAPTSMIWEILTDVPGWSQWNPLVNAASWLDQPPLQTDSHVHLAGARTIRGTWTVNRFEPGRRLLWTRRASGYSTITGHVLASDGSDTTINITMAYTGPLAALIGAWTSRQNQVELERQLAALKRRAEQA